MSVTLQQYLDASSEASTKLVRLASFHCVRVDMLLFAFVQEAFDTVTAVIGNEACDLDSIVSSILYGYCVQHEVTTGERSVVVRSKCSLL